MAQIQNWARVLFEDREGNLWIGAGSGGVAMVRRTEFSVLNAPDSWEGRTVLCGGRRGEMAPCGSGPKGRGCTAIFKMQGSTTATMMGSIISLFGAGDRQ